MKKLLLALTSLLVLTACKDASVNISHNKELFSVEKTVIKEENLFSVMKHYDTGVMGSAVLLDHAKQELISEVEIDDEMKKDANSQLEYLKAMLGEEYLQIIKNIGFETENDYVEKMLYPNLKFRKLMKTEIEKDFDKLSEEYKARQVRILELKTEDAEKVLKEIKDGEDFDKIAKENALLQSQFNGSKQVILLKSSQFPSTISDFLNTNNSPTLSGVLENPENKENSYIVQIIEVDANKIKEDTMNVLVETEEVKNKYEGIVFRNHGFKIFDRDAYDSVLKKNPVYLTDKVETKEKE